MKSQYVKLTLPINLYQEGLQLVKEFGYSNIQDLTVESLRKQILELKREQALINIKKLQGSAKSKPRLTKKQKEIIANNHTVQRAKEITKKYGLEDLKI